MLRKKGAIMGRLPSCYGPVSIMTVALVLLSAPTLAAASGPVVEKGGSGEWATEVSATSATLHAEINPAGNATIYKFEYGVNGSNNITSQEDEVGAGAEAVSVYLALQDLSPSSIYHFRVIAKNNEGEDMGNEESFTTQSTDSGDTLLDGRIWELVSPASKDGALIVPPVAHGGVVQAAEGGGAITYLSVGPVETPIGNSNIAQVFSTRKTSGGWASQDMATPHQVTTGLAQDTGQEYKYFSPELSTGLVEPLGSGSTGTEPVGALPLAPGASELTIYVHANVLMSPESSERGEYDEAAGEGGYLPLVTDCPAAGTCKPSVEKRANVSPLGVEFGGKLEFEGANTDMTHVVIHSAVPLAEKTPEEEEIRRGGLYEWAGGQLQIVSILPNHELGKNARLGGTEGYDARGAVSQDGSRITFFANGSEGEHLYMRDVSGERTVWLDAPEEGAPGGNGLPYFQFASNDGSKIFFTDEARLTQRSTAEEGNPDLYECEIVEAASEPSCALSDLTVDNGGHADVQGVVLSGSSSTEYLYFVAEGVLTNEENGNEKASLGKDNLYMLHYDKEEKEWESPTFIAALSEGDYNDWGGVNTFGEGSDLPGNLERVTSRVSSDGDYLVFMSEGRPTGYDNSDANSGEPDEEVYLYDSLSKHLVCVSCNPTGERPTGVLDSSTAREGEGLLVDAQNNWNVHSWLAGVVPGWTAMKEAFARYQSRYLSNNGRVFFESSDALVPQDTNGLMDVYEYEPEGIPADSPYACRQDSPAFSASAKGCIGLISAGSSGEESVFLDASGRSPSEEEAEDVFFLTSAPLVAADRDTAFDVYDAHVCSELAPCPREAVSPPPCVTESSCKAGPLSQPSFFGASGSATFSGAGNVLPTPAVIVRCSKGKKLGLGKCVKIKGKGRKQGKARKVRKAGHKGRGK